MAVPAGVKLDEGTGYFVGNCFPVRTILKGVDDVSSGAWYVAHKAEQRRTFQALLCPKPKTYEQIKKERKEKESKERRKGSPQIVAEDGVSDGILDGFFLMKHCSVEDPSDLCSVNVTGQDLTEVKADDFSLFDNVAYINAGENLLTLESFSQFPILRELELPLNAIRNVKIELEDFPYLEVLDVSYNNLSSDDVLALGVLPKLKVLYLTGNQIRSLPSQMALPHSVQVNNSAEPAMFPRFGNLEILFLDDNKLTDITTFASLAGLKKLKRLNLDKNEIYSIPHLRALGKSGFDSEPSSQVSTPKSGKRQRPRSGRKSGRGSKTPEVAAVGQNNPDEVKADDKAPTKQPCSSPPLDAALTQTESCNITVHDKDPTQPPGRSPVHDEEPTQLPSRSPMHDEEPTQSPGLSPMPDEEPTQSPGRSPPHDLPPPFPELEYLSLAFNRISDEEGLLAIAAWPLLSELIVNDNPLTTQRSGTPPLLRRYLSDRLGIHMVRKKTTKPNKPSVKVPLKSHRKVTEVARPLPKRPVEFMLEAPKVPNALPQPKPPSSREDSPLDNQPLPPIPAAARPKTEPAEYWQSFNEKLDRTKSWTEESFGQTDVENDFKTTQSADDPVFLTQVDDQEEEKKTEVESKQPKEKTKKKTKPRPDSASKSIDVPRKFKGFEALLDAEDDPNVTIKPDVQSNVRSLRLALKQETHYQNTVSLDKIQKPFQPYKKSQPPMKPPYKNPAQKVETILSEMKERKLLTEENLQQILDDKKKMHQDYPEVVQLLNEIQAKYSAVRGQSIKETKERQRGIQESLNAVIGLTDKMKDCSL